VVAPFLRGYPPTDIPQGGYYDSATLATDVKCLIETLNGGQPCFLVGQDWGAAISYAVLAAYPECIRRAVILAVPHPIEVRRTLRRSPRHVLRSFHWFLFQLPWLPEALCKANDFAFIEFLWKLWSPAYDDRAHVAQIKRMLAQPGAMKATLAYYRAMMNPGKADPSLAGVTARLGNPITTPTHVLCGSRDMRKEMLARQQDLFEGPYEWGIVEGAGHFLHRERPAEVGASIIQWLGTWEI
ncbi:MAG TPA: alpha/beta hydrolase, partial [Pseudoxanthomonas sp.]|nr:alpha/beta hydrolase [Pseudoxanthomonas sp.]